MVGLADGYKELEKKGIPLTSIKPDKEPDKNIVSDVSQLTYIDGLNLTKSEFTKACYVGQSIIDERVDLTGPEKTEHMIELFKSQMKKRFSYNTVFEKLEIKDDLPEDSVNINIIAARFAKKRPLIYLVSDNTTFDSVVVDEKQFDAYDKGPFKKPKI